MPDGLIPWRYLDDQGIAHNADCLDAWQITPHAATPPGDPLSADRLGYCQHHVWIQPDRAVTLAAEQAQR